MFYYFAPHDNSFSGSSIYKLEDNNYFTEEPLPVYNQATHQAFFKDKKWLILEKKFEGTFLDIKNNILIDKATAIQIENGDVVNFDRFYCLNKVNEEYEKAQYLDLVNGKTINIQIKGKLYEELLIQYSRGKLTNTLKLIVKSFDNTKLVISRVEVILPIKFAKQILAKIQDVSYKNFKTKQILLKKIEDVNLTNEELFALNYDFIYNSKINIENEAELFINSGNATQEDIEFLQEKLKTKQFFIDL